MKSQTNNEDGYSVDGSTDNDHSYYEEDEVDSNVFQKEYIENNIFENIHVKEIKLKKNKDKLNQKQSSTQNISTKISHKDLFERINANNSTHKLPLLYWKVSVDSTEDTHHQSLILPYSEKYCSLCFFYRCFVIPLRLGIINTRKKFIKNLFEKRILSRYYSNLYLLPYSRRIFRFSISYLK